MKQVNIEAISKFTAFALIAALLFYMLYSMTLFGGEYSERHTASIEKIIDKALVQCYALEGGYPTELEYIEKYGVLFDDEKYIYHYEWYGGNIKPNIIVVAK